MGAFITKISSWGGESASSFYKIMGLTTGYINSRGIFGGGNTGSSSNVIDYVTISTAGNATSFGEFSPITIRYDLAATSNGTNERGIFAGGKDDFDTNNYLSYRTISSTGNAINYGSLLSDIYSLAATSNGTNERGIYGGGVSDSNVIQYSTISTLGNAVDFGDLTQGREGLSATSNGTNERGVFVGGYYITTNQNIIDYITINSTGNATDFGDLTVSRRLLAATSNA